MNRRPRISPWECCWCADGWEMSAYGSVQPADEQTRGQAAAYFARELGADITEVGVWKRYIVGYTYAEIWDQVGRERWLMGWLDEHLDAPAGVYHINPVEHIRDIRAEITAPLSPPLEWEPDEYDAGWYFVHASHPDAIAVWICGSRDDGPPSRPHAYVSDQVAT